MSFGQISGAGSGADGVSFVFRGAWSYLDTAGNVLDAGTKSLIGV